MTTMNSIELTCPECGHNWNESVYPSICTWLNPELITKMFESGTEISCPACPVKIRVEGKMLINHPGGMFLLELGQSHEMIKHTLIELGVVSKDGIVNLDHPVPKFLTDAYL